jgi:hypothetical protein
MHRAAMRSTPHLRASPHPHPGATGTTAKCTTAPIEPGTPDANDETSRRRKRSGAGNAKPCMTSRKTPHMTGDETFVIAGAGLAGAKAAETSGPKASQAAWS